LTQSNRNIEPTSLTYHRLESRVIATTHDFLPAWLLLHPMQAVTRDINTPHPVKRNSLAMPPTDFRFLLGDNKILQTIRVASTRA
jgi:hypothetical protein